MANQKQRLVYRITHIDNVAWILEHGLHADSSNVRDPHFVSIGNPDLISKRTAHAVPVGPGGTLGDYVPFYFCTRSVMLYKIHTGQVEGVDVPQDDIVYLVSSVERLLDTQVRFVFSDRNAYVRTATFDDDPTHIETGLDWPTIEGFDFRHDKDDPGKPERRMAELLAHQQVPVDSLHGIACIDEPRCMKLKALVTSSNRCLHVASRRSWYF